MKPVPPRPWLCLLTLCLALLWGQAQAASFSAQVDRTSLAINESLTLTLTYTGQTMDGPDISVLGKDFDILAQQKRSQLAFGSGHSDSSTLWILTLAPKSSGNLTIPAIGFKGQQSDPIRLRVLEKGATRATDRDIFLETDIDRSQAYVQGEIILTLRLHTAVMLNSVDFPDLRIPATRAFKLHDTQYQKVINGREYVVVELKYAIFPEQAGTLTIPPLTIAGMVPSANDPFGGSLFGSRGKPVRLRSDELAVEVLPVPVQAANLPWIPAKGLAISQRWSRKPEGLTVGEPVTRTITLTAQGLTGAQIPPLELEDVPGLKHYPDQPGISETLSASGVVGVREQSAALVPTQPGSLELPAVTVRWWDVENQRLQEARLEAQTLEILPAPDTASVQPDTPSTDGEAEAGQGKVAPSDPWLYLSLTANALLLTALVALAMWRRAAPATGAAPGREPANDREADAFRTLMDTPDHQLARLRENLLAWSRLFWPENRISGLTALAILSGREDMAAHFAQLNKNLYGSGSDKAEAVDVAAIKQWVKVTRKSWKADGTRPSPLKPLYPTH